jgi:hypothetical protein
MVVGFLKMQLVPITTNVVSSNHLRPNRLSFKMFFGRCQHLPKKYSVTSVLAYWWGKAVFAIIFWFGAIRIMLINATFNNISVISWRSILSVKETGIPGKAHRPAASHWQSLSHNEQLWTLTQNRGRRGHDRMVVGFLKMQLVPITTNVVSSNHLRRSVLNTTLCDKDCQWLAAGRWAFPGIPVSFTDKIDRHDITEIFQKRRYQYCYYKISTP